MPRGQSERKLIVGTSEALNEEFEAIHGEARPLNGRGEHEKEQAALCLSGGGVRSAAFCLGALQGLAERGLLSKFHYLSTVSGGGFIAGWLSMMVSRLGADTAQQRLANSYAETGRHTPPELRALREFTNYLTPRGGAFSIDTWTALVLVGRNFILNWLVFLPWFLAIVVLAMLYRETLLLTGGSGRASIWLLAIVIPALFIGVVGMCLGLPSHRPMRKQPGCPEQPDYFTRQQAVWRIVVPVLVWTAVLPMTFSRHWRSTEAPGPEWVLPLGYVAVTLAGYVFAWVWDARRHPARQDRSPFLTNLRSWAVASLAAGGFMWLGLYLGRTSDFEHHADLLAVAAPLWFVLVTMLHSAVHVALRPEADRADLDREWLAHISATKLRPTLLWAGFAACCLVLPHALPWAVEASYAALAAGPIGAWLGKQVLGRAQGGPRPVKLVERAFTVVPLVLCVVFTAALFASLGAGVGHILDQAAEPPRYLNGGSGQRVGYLVLALVVLAVSASYLGRQINVNRFSLHGVYRNRITRAFLGSARKEGDRHAEPLTGFDNADVATMSSLFRQNELQRLFLVVNTTLNLSFSERVAWSERKAAPFTITPLRSGADALPRPGQDAAEDPYGRFVRSDQYGGLEHTGAQALAAANAAKGPSNTGIRLPGALTISGAAVSPNWGYHSSPLTAFVMTLFNVRLGAWLPNPANPSVAKRPELLAAAMPRDSAGALFRELVGWTDARSEAVYLSDGGHFDNLGLFEMLRRRCRFILVVDAGQDPDAVLRDLGEAIRKADVDLNTVITLKRSGILSRVDAAGLEDAEPQGYAAGTISYPDCEAGVLLYLKASWLRDLPIEVQAYGDRHSDFPHETTLDQSFSESQFESYRALGREQTERMLKSVKDPGFASLRGVFEHLRPKVPLET